MDTTQTYIQDNYNETMPPSIAQMQAFLRNVITDEIKNACPGVMIITLTIEEYETLHRLLSESSERKKQDIRQSREHKRRTVKTDQLRSTGLTLDVIR